MSSFEVAARSISIESHPDADAIEIAKINGTEYVSIVRKDAEMKTGDVVIYIPEQAIVPESILREMGLWDDEKGKGGLAATALRRNRPQ
jgi:predicted RNA-binding protein with EMAP domain